MEDRSKILIIGVTGNLGFHLAKTSVEFAHPTFALVRDSAFSQSDKLQKLQTLTDAGVRILKGSLQDEEKLMEAVKLVDVVICAVAATHALDQKLLIRVIKQAGCIKRFVPSEFGMDPDRVQIRGMDYDFYSKKAEIRRLVEAEGILHTYVSCNFYTSYLLPSLVQPGLKLPPRDRVKIFGDGNVKAVFVMECDVAAFTISTVDDPRTLNKVLYLRPLGNVVSMNELVEMWEHKIRKKVEKVNVSSEELLRAIKETPYPDNMELIFVYSAFIKGDQTYFDIEVVNGLEGTQLYPRLSYTTVGQYLDTMI
ncbi:unnamed protein product [Rhodiola kirilowii]